MSDKTQCRAAFAQRLDGTLGEDAWRHHLTTCDGCRTQARDLGTLMAPLHNAEPPTQDAAHIATLEDRFLAQIQEDDATPEPAGAPAGRNRWLTVLAVAAGFLVLIGAAWLARGWLGMPNADKRADRTSDGMGHATMKGPAPRTTDKILALRVRSTVGRVIHRKVGGPASDTMPPGLSPDAELETMGGKTAVVLEAPAQDLWLRLGPRSRLRRMVGKQRRLRLERGELMVEVRSKQAGGSLAIHTPQGTVTVRGTRFGVQTSATSTVVTVFRGQVHYRSRVAGEHLVGAGKRLKDEASRVTLSAIQTPGPTPDKGAMARPTSSGERDTGRQKGPAECSLSRVRKLIRTGRAQAARKSITACRKLGVHSTTTTVLKMLDAQALLALGKVGKAVRAYHRIARQHRGSRLGQNALFTAGQLELSRLGRKKRALATFKRYLKVYPSGRYASEARQLMRNLEAGK